MRSIRSYIYVLLVSLTLAFPQSSSSLGIAMASPLSAVGLGCLASGQPIPFIIARVYKVSETPGIDPNGAMTLSNAWNQGYDGNGYIEICRGQNATDQINLVASALGGLLDTLFIKVEPNDTPDCSWESYSPSDNCNFLTEALNAIINSQNIAMPGVFSTALLWKEYFGSSCDSIGNLLNIQLWYASYDTNGKVNSDQSFDDYVPFGGFTVQSGAPYMKQVGGDVSLTLCGNADWHTYVELVWSLDD